MEIIKSSSHSHCILRCACAAVLLAGAAWAQNPLRINEIYFAASFTNLLGATDQYIELYNTSATEPAYLDGMVIARFGVLGSTSANSVNGLLMQAYKFPGAPGGRVYPVAPHAFIVIARNAQDFSSNGGLDLSGADWEFYSGDPLLDQDNPAPNLAPLAASLLSQDFLMGTTDDAIALCDGTDTTIGDGIAIASIVDAVEYHSGVALHKIFSPQLDAGYAGKNVRRGLSVERKSAGYDTDNSSVDFDTTVPTPGYEHGAGGGAPAMLPDIYPLAPGGYSLFDEFTLDTNGVRVDSTLHPYSQTISGVNAVRGGRSAAVQVDSTFGARAGSSVRTQYLRNPGGTDVQQYADADFYRNILGPLASFMNLSEQWVDMFNGNAVMKAAYPVMTVDTSFPVSGITVTVQVQTTGEWAGVDSVAVPAGTFAAYVFKLTTHAQASALIGSLFDQTFVRTVWLARGVGMVKQVSPPANFSIPGQGSRSMPGYEDDLRMRGDVTAVAAPVENEHAPAVAALEQNYPNPFSGSTRIRFSVPERRHILLALYDALGRCAEVLAEGVFPAGVYETTCSASGLPDGEYTLVLTSPSSRASRVARRMLIVR